MNKDTDHLSPERVKNVSEDGQPNITRAKEKEEESCLYDNC